MSTVDSPKESKPTALKRVRFLTQVAGAKEVILTGDFTNWATDKIKLNSIGEGEWETILKLPSGDYQYRLIVDGQWKDDTRATKRVPNSFGTENNILTV